MTGILGCAVPINALDIQTVTVGAVAGEFALFGYSQGSYGSISDGTSNIYGGATVETLYWSEADSWVEMRIDGVQANSGWSSMTIGSTAFTRSSAAFFASGGNSFWRWNTGTNPFGPTAGATKIVMFT